MGETISSMNPKDLKSLEKQLEAGVRKMRSRKVIILPIFITNLLFGIDIIYIV